MGCGAVRAKKTHPAPAEPSVQLSSVIPDASSNKEVAAEGTKAADELFNDLAGDNADDDDATDDGDDETSDGSDESMPGEPMEAKWARAAKRKKKLARQRRRAAKAAKAGSRSAVPTCISSFSGMRRPKANPQKDGCFDRQCFLSTNRSTIDEMYDISINLGKGTFGTVERCTHRKTKMLRAIKTIPKKKVYHEDRIANEVEVMRILEHPHIVKLYEAFEDDKCIYIAMELCNGGELLDKVMILKGGGLSEKAAATVMQQVTSAVYYMHQQLVCHRDLKPENFLLTYEVEDVANAHIKVIDFGFSTRFTPGGFMSTRACTNNYVAPEVLNGKYTEACDIWSLGVVIYVLLSGQKPFWGDDEAQMLDKVARCAYNFDDPPCWTSTSNDAKDIIRRILVLESADRLTAVKMLEHAWIAQLAPRASMDRLQPEVMAQLRAFDTLGKFKRAAMTALAQQLHEDSINELAGVFQALDEDGDGSLSIAEMKRGLKQVGVQVSEEVPQLLPHVDSDGSGMVEYTEFLAATITEKKHLQEDGACRAAFQVFDEDNNGKITKDEMAKLLSCNRAASLVELSGSDRTDIEQAVAEADIDGDGQLDFREFQALLQSACARLPVQELLPNAAPT